MQRIDQNQIEITPKLQMLEPVIEKEQPHRAAASSREPAS